jgi:hypothetical protein
MPPYLPLVPLFIWVGCISAAASIINRIFGDLSDWQSAFWNNAILCGGSIVTGGLIIFLARRHFARRLKGFGLDIDTIHKDFCGVREPDFDTADCDADGSAYDCGRQIFMGRGISNGPTRRIGTSKGIPPNLIETSYYCYRSFYNSGVRRDAFSWAFSDDDTLIRIAAVAVDSNKRGFVFRGTRQCESLACVIYFVALSGLFI